MKALVLSMKDRYDHFAPDLPIVRETEMVFCRRSGTEEEWLAAAGDADVLFTTPVTWIRESLLARMPNLKLIHSEGVGFDRIDLEAARKRGIYVCNNAGCNAGPVAEQAVMLMTMLLHRILWGHRMVLSGRQGEAVGILEGDVPPDLSSAKVGLVGFGAIGQETAARLRPNGTEVYYYARHRRDEETEKRLGVTYLPLEELTARCDIVSLHLPATAESTHMVDRDFLARRGLPYSRAYFEGVAHTALPLAAEFTKEFCHLEESCQEIIDEWMEMSRGMYAKVPLKPGVRAYLKQCKAEGRRMAVVTSSVPEHCYTALKKLDIEKYFENVTFAQQAGMHKKEPDVWLAAAAKNGVHPEACTVFDDSLAACWGARAARMRVVGVHDSFFNKDEKEMRAFCDVYIDSFEELLYTPEQKARRK